MSLSDQELDRIAERVAAKLQAEPEAPNINGPLIDAINQNKRASDSQARRLLGSVVQHEEPAEEVPEHIRVARQAIEAALNAERGASK